MATKKTTAEIAKEVTKGKETFINKLRKQKKVKVLGNEGLVPFLGTVFTIHVNGVTVSLPLDGKYHEFPEGIAKLLERKLSKIAKINLPVNSTEKIY